MADAEFSERLEAVKQRFIERTEGHGIPELELLYTRAMKDVTVVGSKHREDAKLLVLMHLSKFVEDDANI